MILFLRTDPSVDDELSESEIDSECECWHEDSETDSEVDENHPIVIELQKNNPHYVKHIEKLKVFQETEFKSYQVNLKIKPLSKATGNDIKKYYSWKSGMVTLLKLHRVWCIVGRDCFGRLPGSPCSHELAAYPGLKQWKAVESRMASLAVALIYANINEELRGDEDVVEAILWDNPGKLMDVIDATYGPKEQIFCGDCRADAGI